MRIRKMLACYGNGKVYIKIRIKGYELNAQFAIRACTPGQLPLPISIYPFERKDKKERDLYVIELPIMEIPRVNVNIDFLLTDGKINESSLLKLNYSSLKWQSRFNYRIRKKSSFEIRNYEQNFILDQFHIKGLCFLEGDDCIVWRFFIEWKGAINASPKVLVIDLKGEPLDVEPLLFEEQTLVGTSPLDTPCKRLFLSIKLDKSLETFCILVEDGFGNYRSGSYCVDREAFSLYKYETWKHMRDARADDLNYRKWFALHHASSQDLRKQRMTGFEYVPKISIIVPCYNSTDLFISDMAESVLGQSYENWELLLLDASPETGVIKRFTDRVRDTRVRYLDLGGNKGIVGNTNYGIEEASGEFIAFLDHDDMLELDALYEYVKCVNEHPGVKLLFCDEDMFKSKGVYCQPVFKTQLNLDLLYSHNCVTHFLMIRTSFLRTLGLSPNDVAGAQDYDLTLRAIEANGEVYHVPRVLYHWRQHTDSTCGDNTESKPYAEEAGRRALEAHFERREIAARVITTDHPFVYRVLYSLPTPHPEVSIIIPSKDHIDVLAPCVESIIGKSTYDNYRIVIVENNSTQQETFRYYEQLQEAHPCVSVVKWEHEFNYSKIINFGVCQTTSPYLLLLNNDTQVISADFIEEMLGYLQRPEVGVVGAKLYYRDGLTQHAGMLIGPYRAVCHVNQDFPPSREGYLSRAVRPGNFSSVTGACQMIKRSSFESVGGYNEDLAVGFNDVDFCLKMLKAGYRVVFSPYAELFHYEFVTRGREVVDPIKQERWQQERDLFEKTWPECFKNGDPFTNSNLDKDSFYYALPQI